MSASRTKPPRKGRAGRETAAPPRAASGDPIASAHATAVARAILAAADLLAAGEGGTGRRRLINHLRGNQLPRKREERPGPGFAVLESHRAGWVEEAVDRLSRRAS